MSLAGHPGRPKIAPELRQLIRRMWQANSWGSPRIVAELQKLGIEVAKSTVEKCKPRGERSPSATWRTFLEQHVKNLVAIDFFVVPTATFKVLFVFLVLAHDRRRIVHFNVTEHPSARWTAQQIVEAFPSDTAPRYLLRDGDGIDGARVQRRIESLGIEEVVTAPDSPWQNAYVERMIGSLRRELLDHVINYQRTSSQATSGFVSGLLSSVANAPVFGPGCAGRAPRTVSGTKPGHRDFRRAGTPSLLSSEGRMSIRDRQCESES